MTQVTPIQLVFGRDAILNIKFDANWKYIREWKQQKLNTNNRNENKQTKKVKIPHHYCEGAQVLCRVDSMSKYSENPYDGPNTIVQVNTNGTVWLKMGAVIDTGNIQLLKPYCGW